MLDEKTLVWLKTRENTELECGLYSCNYCRFCSDEYDPMEGYCTAECSDDCPIVADMQDVAEFEARVAAKLMSQYEKNVQCAEITGGFCPNRDTMLMYARLAVEAEMERGDKRGIRTSKKHRKLCRRIT